MLNFIYGEVLNLLHSPLSLCQLSGEVAGVEEVAERLSEEMLTAKEKKEDLLQAEKGRQQKIKGLRREVP